MTQAPLKINPKQNKALFFSDLHLGVHQNSQVWQNVALDLADWINQIMIERKLDTIFFGGDVFHDRHEIGVSTLHVAKRFFDKLSAYQIYMIPGNHDAFLSATVDINSIEILENKNVYVFTKPQTLEVGERKVTLCPWKTNVTTLDPVDLLLGHFEIVNFRMNPTKVCDHGDGSAALLEKATAVVSGHFHIRDFRDYGSKYILYLGSPYEMDFGDRGQSRGVSIIDFDDLSVEFIENNITPKHQRIMISELVARKYSDLASVIKNNIVSVYVDSKVDTLTLDLLVKKLASYNPLQLRTEFNILDDAQTDIKNVQKLSIDIETAFHEFIEHVETRATKQEVLNKCLELYKSSQTFYE